jgi:hypothetical protein
MLTAQTQNNDHSSSSKTFTENNDHTVQQVFTQNTGHTYSSNRYLQSTLTILTAQTGIYTEHWPNLQLKQVFTEKSVIKIHSSKWKQEKTMKYHNRMGEGWWEARNYNMIVW